MRDILERVLTAQSKYENALVDLNYAPKGNSLIDNDIKSTYEECRAEYKQSITEAITCLTETLSNL